MEIAEWSQQKPLMTVSLNLFFRRELIQRCRLPEERLIQFLSRIERGYRPVPYHNSTHAAEVTHSTHYLLTQISVMQSITEWEWLGALLSAVVHDFEHPGLNNTFHVNALTPLALTYNDDSPLENHHIAASFKVMTREETNIFCHVPMDVVRNIRKQMITMVLDTDLKHHFENLGRFKTMTDKGVDYDSHEDRLRVFSMALKCADVSHSAKDWPMHCDWSTKVLEGKFFWLIFIYIK